MDKSELESISRALALIPSGCCILTCREEGNSTGMLASWVQQAAFEPPMVTVALKRGRPIEGFIEKSGGFTLNLLGEDPWPFFKHFGAGFDPDEPAFRGLSTADTAHGVALEDAVGHLDCVVRGTLQAGDHTVYVAEVASGKSLSQAKPYVHIRKSGMSY